MIGGDGEERSSPSSYSQGRVTWYHFCVLGGYLSLKMCGTLIALFFVYTTPCVLLVIG